WGRRPFGGSSIEALARAKATGVLSVPARPRVPTWLQAVVMRGLSPSPAERFASMADVVRQLEQGRGRARRRRLAATVASVGAVIGMLALGYVVDRARREAGCEAEGEEIAWTWNAQTREELRAALVATNVPHAPVTADKVMPWL